MNNLRNLWTELGEVTNEMVTLLETEVDVDPEGGFFGSYPGQAKQHQLLGEIIANCKEILNDPTSFDNDIQEAITALKHVDIMLSEIQAINDTL